LLDFYAFRIILSIILAQTVQSFLEICWIWLETDQFGQRALRRVAFSVRVALECLSFQAHVLLSLAHRLFLAQLLARLLSLAQKLSSDLPHSLPVLFVCCGLASVDFQIAANTHDFPLFFVGDMG